MAPLIAVQIMGVLYQVKIKKSTFATVVMADINDNAILDFEEE